ncbi:hypothetical protein T265_15461 [Opisthorchis viverrini]|uniref:Ribonuclease P protein subunit p29 n=1 Tax=Opisthorchis viverrini TaxID=6198 RepID=A0A074Z2L5_OPIVI|nr:hypothetical protein T265_15461 [Opisthorchis viverrini]KER19747.1 hypothetical protein T265_15461 [Opisthorchis viverrini]
MSVSQKRSSGGGKSTENQFSSPSSMLATSEFVRQFVRRHVAPEQRAQSDLPLRPGLAGATYNLNLVPQSTRRVRQKRCVTSSDSATGPVPKLIKPSKRRLTGVMKPDPASLVVPSSLPTQLHQLWLGYAKTVINWSIFESAQSRNNSSTNQLESILRMNLIGARVRIIRSTSCSLAGREAIIVMETKFMFRVAVDHPRAGKSSNKTVNLVSVPKVGSLFALLPCCSSETFTVLLYGDQLTHRPVDRAVRKWRRPLLRVPLGECRIPSVSQLCTDILSETS